MLITLNNTRAVLHTRMTARMAMLVRQMEGGRKWLTGGGLSFEPTRRNFALLRDQIPSLTLDVAADAPADILDAASDIPRVLPAEDKPQAAPPEDVEGSFDIPGYTPTYQSRTQPYDHQRRALDLLLEKRRFALFMEQGTGKTKVAIDAAGTRFVRGEITGLLVVAPKGVHRQWVESQIPHHCGVPTNCAYWPLPAKQRPLPSKLAPSDRLAVLAINIDGIKTKDGAASCIEFLRQHKGRVMMVLDESHMIKDASTMRWEAAKSLGDYAAYRLAMTGTPIAKDLTDEWSQLKWLDENILGIRYVTHFRNEFCIMGGYEGREVLGTKNLERFKKLVDPYTFRATKQEIGILPKAYDRWTFDLNSEQKRLIRSIKNELAAEISSGAITTAANAALKLMRIQQISNGFVTDENKIAHRIFPTFENPRIIALKELIENRSGKIVIWCRFIEDIRMVMESLGSEAVAYYGAIKDEDRAKAVAAFLDPTGPRFFVSNPATGGTGLNLQGACENAIYFSNSDNSIERWQSEDRIHRIGTAGSVVYTDLIGKGAIDLRILANMQRKKRISDMALGDIQKWLTQDWDEEEASDVDYQENWLKESTF